MLHKVRASPLRSSLRLVTPFSPLHAVIQLANKLLTHAGISKEVKTAKQCNSVLLTQLYEALTGSRVPGIVSLQGCVTFGLVK